MFLALTAIVVIVVVAALLLGALQRDSRFTILMGLYGAVLAGGTCLSFMDSVPTSDWISPYLLKSDGEAYFDQAQLLALYGIENFQTVVRSNYAGYQIMLALLFLVFGPSLAVGLIANVLLLLISAVCLYRATLLLSGSQQMGRLASAAFMLTPSHIFYALVLLKEPALSLAFALILLSLAQGMHGTRVGLKPVLYVSLALVLIMSMRASLLLFLFVLMSCLGTLLLKRRAHLFAGFAAIALLIVPFAQSFTIYELDPAYFTATVLENRVIASRLEGGEVDITGIAGRIIGTYIYLPFPVKLILFPIPLVAQVLLPFDFWSTIFLDSHFASIFSKNLNPLWYLFVAVWAGFAVWKIRAPQPPLLRRTLIAGLFYYIVVAVIYGGLIPRYGAPALLFVYPAIGYWWSQAMYDPKVKLEAKRFFGHYLTGAVLAGFAFLAFQFMR